jgi:succinate dehydrogenase/fumarate reductase flavoprotein subunit
VEKAKTERSGHGGAGLDTVIVYPPGGTGDIFEEIKSWQRNQSNLNGEGRFADPNIAYRQYTHTEWTLEEMIKLDLPMKWDDGKYNWEPTRDGHIFQLCVHWLDIKPKMAASVRKRGVNVLDRVMVVDLLTNKDKVVGATAVNTRTGEFIVIKAKTVVIAAGPFARSYEPETPQFYKYKMRYHGAPGAISGDSWAAGYRAGLELANMDIGNLWNFRLRDDITMPYGQVVFRDGLPGKAFTGSGIPIEFMGNSRLYAELENRGLTPIYRSLEHFSDDYQKRAEVATADERLISLKFSEERGFDPKSHRYELMVNKPHNFGTISGIVADENFKTALKNCFVIGDACAGLASGGPAILSACLIGDDMPKYVSEAQEPVVDEGQVESQKQTALAPLAVKDGTMPMEFECAVRHINERYAGMFKSEGKLREGLRRLDSLRREFFPKLMAKNPHYLMRCLEAKNIMDLTELHLQACLERKESRGNYLRMDHPERDPKRDNMVTYQRLKNGKPVLEIKEVPDLKPEYVKESK